MRSVTQRIILFSTFFLTKWKLKIIIIIKVSFIDSVIYVVRRCIEDNRVEYRRLFSRFPLKQGYYFPFEPTKNAGN